MEIRHLERKISHYITLHLTVSPVYLEHGAGSIVMVTLLCSAQSPRRAPPRPASYSVVWQKLGMAMAGDTTALDTVRFTGLNWLTWERECGISDAPERSGQCHLGHDGLDH